MCIFSEDMEKFEGSVEDIFGANYKKVICFACEEEEGIGFVKEDNTVVLPLGILDNVVEYGITTFEDIRDIENVEYNCYNAKGYKIAYLSDNGSNLKTKSAKLKISKNELLEINRQNLKGYYTNGELKIYETTNKIYQFNICDDDLITFVLYKELEQVPTDARLIYKNYIPSYKSTGLSRCSLPEDFLAM